MNSLDYFLGQLPGIIFGAFASILAAYAMRGFDAFPSLLASRRLKALERRKAFLLEAKARHRSRESFMLSSIFHLLASGLLIGFFIALLGAASQFAPIPISLPLTVMIVGLCIFMLTLVAQTADRVSATFRDLLSTDELKSALTEQRARVGNKTSDQDL